MLIRCGSLLNDSRTVRVTACCRLLRIQNAFVDALEMCPSVVETHSELNKPVKYDLSLTVDEHP